MTPTRDPPFGGSVSASGCRAAIPLRRAAFLLLIATYRFEVTAYLAEEFDYAVEHVLALVEALIVFRGAITCLSGDR
jgi:hypothetical protein